MASKKKLSELLKQVPSFVNLDEKIIKRLEEKMTPKIFKQGENLCTEGEAGDQMFIIDSGEVCVMKADDKGKAIEIAALSHGDIAGEMSLFGKGLRSATLKAKTPVKLWSLDYGNFQCLFEEHPSLAKAVLSNLCQHLRLGGSVIARLMSTDPDKRFKIAMFDAKPYSDEAFKSENKHNYLLQAFHVRLSLNTVSLAAGFKVVCAFVNDDLSRPVVDELAALGVKMIAMRCAGFNNVDLDACKKAGIAVTRVPAYSPYAVAEHAVALMLTLNRQVHRAHNRVREGNFSLEGLVGFDLHGKTVGVFGTGKIGECLIKIVHGFGCKVLGNNGGLVMPDLSEKYGVEFVERDELFQRSDIISLHAPLMKATHHMINKNAISKMKEGVMFINTSRGGLVETQALIDGLKNGKIGFAGLDVYEEEGAYFFEDFSAKVMQDDLLARLTTFNNVIVTSHQGFLTQEALSNIAKTTLESIRAFETGEQIPNRVEKT